MKTQYLVQLECGNQFSSQAMPLFQPRVGNSHYCWQCRKMEKIVAVLARAVPEKEKKAKVR